MKVAFDARHAGRGLGISTFVRNLARELVATGEIELTWLGDPALAPAGTARAVPLHRTPYPLLDGPAGRALVRRLAVDVTHFTANTGWGRRGPVPTVLTLHDLIFMTTTISHRNLRQVVGHRYERCLVRRAVAAADVLAVPSQTVADEVLACLGPGASPQLVYEGVSMPSGVLRAAPSRELVAFAGRDPRKLTGEVVKAWRELSPLALHLHLLASGGLPAELRESLAPDVAAGRVQISEHLSPEALWTVLAGAFALVYPSRTEGFGLPVLEGMAAGTPVLAGVAPATREVGGDAIVALDGEDVARSIVVAVGRLDREPGWRAELVSRGRRRAQEFSWGATAAGYLELYRTAAGAG